MIKSLILGIVQGLCEFLPVSSSGHLALFQYYFGFDTENLVAFDLLLHLATVMALIIYFRNDIISVIKEWFVGWFGKHSNGWTYGWAILIATFFTGGIGLSLRDVVDKMSSSPVLVSLGLIFTAIILACVPILSHNRQNSSLLKAAIFVGIAQGIAVLPGVSRSGMTIAASLLMGMGVHEAFRFSFMISIPAILGANLLEGIKMLKSGESVFLQEGYMIAFLAAFILGITSLGIMRKLVASEKWVYFGIYCFIVGLATVLVNII